MQSAVLLLSMLMAATPIQPGARPAQRRPPRRHRAVPGPVNTAKEAKAIAEQETGGRAVSANRIPRSPERFGPPGSKASPASTVVNDPTRRTCSDRLSR